MVNVYTPFPDAEHLVNDLFQHFVCPYFLRSVGLFYLYYMVQTVGRDKNYRVKQINNSFLSLFHISFILLFV